LQAAGNALAESTMIHLNHAGASLMPPEVVAAITDHLRLEAEIGGYEAADARAAEIEAAYDETAVLIGVRRRNIAIVENATVAVAQALSAFDLSAGDEIVTTRHDYVSNQLMYLSLARRRGVRVTRVPDLPEGGVDPDAVREQLRHRRPALVALTHVPTNSGLVQPAAEVGEICAEHGVPYLVDACQSVGQFPVDVSDLRCDFLAGTARKFLRGPRGIGFLYVSDRMLEEGRAPLLPDMRGARWTGPDAFELAPDARRFENWEFAYALVLGMGAAARMAREVGMEEAMRHNRFLAIRLREELGEMPGVRVLDRGPELCAIVTAEVAGWEADDLVVALRDRGVNTSGVSASSALLDMQDKGAATALRISPHYSTTADEVDRALQALRSVLGID
jgi:selenocysteine lyase/cysteine desulfurase